MTGATATAQLEAALAPHLRTLGARRRSHAWRRGLARGVRRAPAVALALGGTVSALRLGGLVDGGILVLAGLVGASVLVPAIWRVALDWMAPPTVEDAAIACDRAAGWHDRLSAAWEFQQAGATDPMRRAAIEDGLLALSTLATRPIRLPVRRVDIPLAPAFLACLVLWACALVPSTAAPSTRPVDLSAKPRMSGDTSATAEQRATPDSRPNQRAASRPASRPAAESEPVARRAQARPTPATTAPAASAGNAGRQGSAAAEGSDSSGASEVAQAKSGEPSPGAGGSGAAAGSSAAAPPPSAPQKKPQKRDSPPTPNKPSRPSREDSIGATGGASKNRGMTTPTGGRKELSQRANPAGDDARSPDEDTQDEREETEQRGGVAPLQRDRPKPPSRELSISGDGPPDDGRGGPTPPKKSRGTAALVLGITLEDQVRGQPNPGTARTSMGRIPPIPEPDPNGQRSAAAHAAAPATPQPPHVLDARFWGLVQRFHERLRQSEPSEKP